MVGAAGFPCGQFSDENCLQAGLAVFALRAGKTHYWRANKNIAASFKSRTHTKQLVCSSLKHIKNSFQPMPKTVF